MTSGPNSGYGEPMKGDTNDRISDGAARPFSPVTLVLATEPGDLAGELGALAEAGKKDDAHRLAEPHIGEVDKRGALAGFYLREVAGRRGARLVLRWLRADEAADEAERVFVARTMGAVEAWAQFRLLRHERAMTLAKRALERLKIATEDTGENPADGALRDEARAWGQSLEAIRRCGLRRGNLRLALNFHSLAEELGRLHPGCLPQEQRSRAAMMAVAFLLELHTDHGLPATVARYLARSLGHDEGDSPPAYAELVGDLSLRPEHLDGALEVAERFGFAEQVSAPIQTARERLFRGNWKVRRTAQRGLVVLVFVVGAVLVLLGFTIFVHLVTR
jgi:hypothetical protein